MSASGVKSGSGDALDATDEFIEAAPKDDLGRCESITGKESSVLEEEREGSPGCIGPSEYIECTGVAQTD